MCRPPRGALLLPLALSTSVAAFGPSSNWTKVTWYDVLQEDCRGGLGDNNVGNPAGDIYFTLKDMYVQLGPPAPDLAAAPTVQACAVTRHSCVAMAYRSRHPRCRALGPRRRGRRA